MKTYPAFKVEALADSGARDFLQSFGEEKALLADLENIFSNLDARNFQRRKKNDERVGVYNVQRI